MAELTGAWCGRWSGVVLAMSGGFGRDRGGVLCYNDKLCVCVLVAFVEQRTALQTETAEELADLNRKLDDARREHTKAGL